MAPASSPLGAHWTLDPAIAFLNHGSFGACPIPVLEAQQRWRARMERQPVQFFTRDLEGLLDEARAALAAFLVADAEGLAFVPNATTGVSAVMRSLRLAPGDELVVTDHAYNACRNAVAEAARAAGARLVVARVPFPLVSEGQVVDAVLAAVGARTRLVMVDHVTSPTGLVLPVASLVGALAERGIDALVDGAHAPGMVPVDLQALGAAYYAGNCHKWVCAPKGAGFLWVRADRRAAIHPLVTSHGANSPRTDRSRFRLEFDWTGTADPSPYLCVPEALRFMGGLLDGGWAAVRAANRALALHARQILCGVLGIPPPAPDAMIGALVTLPIADGSAEPPASALYADPLQDELLGRFAIEVPVAPFPAPPRRVLRVSAQLYNQRGDYERLATALGALGLGRG